MALAGMPFCDGTTNAFWIRPASAASGTPSPVLLAQYCITMEIDADPPPSIVCATKGTSIQIPGCGEARASTAPAKHTRMARNRERTLMRSLTNGNNNENQCRDGDKNDDQVAVAHPAGRKVSLRFFCPGGQLRQLVVIQLWDCILDLPCVQMGRFQRMLSFRGGNEFL